MPSRSCFLALVLSLLSHPCGAQEQGTPSPLLPAQNALGEFLPEVAAQRLSVLLASGDLSDEIEEQARILLAEALIRSDKPAEAAKALAPLPDSPVRQYWRAIALAQSGEDAAALEQFTKIPPDASPYWELGTYNRLEILTLQGSPAAAFELLAELRAAYPDFKSDALALLEAQLHLQKNEPDQARKSLANLPKLSPRALLLAGEIELAAQAPQEALNFFTKISSAAAPPALQRLALLGQADAWLLQGKGREALVSLISILATDPPDEFLTLLYPRFETALALPEPEPSAGGASPTYAALLRDFVNPTTLGEDANYATSAKELACYYLSRSLSEAEALPLLERLLALAPESEIAARAELSAAELLLQQGEQEAAVERLRQVSTHCPEGDLPALAADILARIATSKDDFAAAQELFQEASRHPHLAFSEQALLNQTLLALESGQDPEKSPSAVSSRLTSSEARSAYLLERALALTKENKPEAKSALNDFLASYPGHSREAEARLSLLDNLVGEVDPDFALIEAQLDALPKTLPNQRLSRLRFQVCHRLGAITNSWSDAVTFGEGHLRVFPESENDPLFLLRLAESYYRDDDNNQARFLFNKVAEMENAGELRDIALLFGARANLAIPTPEARVEALAILEELTSRGGPLTTQARLMLARTYLTFGKAEECLATLALLPGEPADQPEAALLEAEAYSEQGSQDSANYQKAIAIYEQLLADPRTSYESSNQIHYLIARTYRKSGHPELALEPCLSVVDFENWPAGEAESEWDYYFKCGFEALDILLKAEHYKAALTLALKLAKNGQGPGAEQAEIRAKQIQLDHMLWEE